MDLSMSIYTFKLSTRAYNVAIREGILTLQDIISKKNYLRTLKGVGDKVLNEFNNLIFEEIKKDKEAMFTSEKILNIIYEPIDTYDMSNRTINTILAAGYNNVLDLLDNEDNIYSIPGIGRKGIGEIENAINSAKNRIINEYVMEIFNPNRDSTSNIDYVSSEEYLCSDYSDYRYYLPIKRNTSGGQLSKREEWKLPINDYFYLIYKKEKEFCIVDLLETFLDSLSDIEFTVIKNVICFVGNENIIKYVDIARQYQITGERVRQIEKSIYKKIGIIINSLKAIPIGRDYINDNEFIDENCEFKVLSFKDKMYDKINGRFLSYVLPMLFSEKYNSTYLTSSGDITETFIIYKKDLLDKKLIANLFKNIDKVYNEKRPEEATYSKDLLLSKVLKSSELGIVYGNSKYMKILNEYLGYRYYIFEFNGSYTFPANKKDLKYFINKELELLDEPIHFTDMYNIVIEKYPDQNRNVGKVHTALRSLGKNVGDGLYVKKSSKLIEGTAVGLAEIYLERQGEPAFFDDIEDFVLKNRRVKKGSLQTLMFGTKKNSIFVKTSDHKIGLKKWNLPNVVDNWKYNYTLDNEIYEYMKKNPIEEYTIQNIMKAVGNDNYQTVYYVMTSLVKNGKIGFFTRGLVNYYYII